MKYRYSISDVECTHILYLFTETLIHISAMLTPLILIASQQDSIFYMNKKTRTFKPQI